MTCLAEVCVVGCRDFPTPLVREALFPTGYRAAGALPMEVANRQPKGFIQSMQKFHLRQPKFHLHQVPGLPGRVSRAKQTGRGERGLYPPKGLPVLFGQLRYHTEWLGTTVVPKTKLLWSHNNLRYQPCSVSPQTGSSRQKPQQ